MSLRARKEYREACAAMRKNKLAQAEKQLRKAVEDFRKYVAAARDEVSVGIRQGMFAIWVLWVIAIHQQLIHVNANQHSY
jgi:hypothetical protein